jgi:hypothetical protein
MKEAAMKLPWVLPFLLAMSACGEPPAPAADTPATAPPGTPASATTSTPETWEGQWNGPEGLFLRITHKDGGTYELTLKDNLDSEAVYGAQAEGEVLRFTRGGAVQTIRPGTGAETGFKYLADKQDCLIVVAGSEGYCRD